MLIVNADDFGVNQVTTDRIKRCHEEKRITSTSAMMFMVDSERAAAVALSSGLEAGLHLNFTSEFTKADLPSLLQDYQKRIVGYFLKNKFNCIIPNPFLRKEFEYVYQCQYEEFEKLFGTTPPHMDGHHHMHLSSNLLLQNLVPRRTKFRRNFTFIQGEKGIFNRIYRKTIDQILLRRFVCTDYFFSINPIRDAGRLTRIVNLSTENNVELMVHPHNNDEYEFLMNSEYWNTVSMAKWGKFADLELGNG